MNWLFAFVSRSELAAVGGVGGGAGGKLKGFVNARAHTHTHTHTFTLTKSSFIDFRVPIKAGVLLRAS